MITVTRVTVYDSVGRHFTTKVSQSFDSLKKAKEFYKEDLSSDEFQVKMVLLDYEEDEIDD